MNCSSYIYKKLVLMHAGTSCGTRATTSARIPCFRVQHRGLQLELIGALWSLCWQTPPQVCLLLLMISGLLQQPNPDLKCCTNLLNAQ